MRIAVVFLALFLLFGATVSAQGFATCDLCGFCPPAKAPANWEACRSCIYPAAPANPAARATLRIDATTGQAPTPAPGKQYTLVGCLSTNVASFSEEGGATSVVQSLLSIVFSIAGGIAFLYVLYGSFTVLVSRGNVERLNHGRRILYGAIVGLIFCLFSLFLIQFFATQILAIPGFGE